MPDTHDSSRIPNLGRYAFTRDGTLESPYRLHGRAQSEHATRYEPHAPRGFGHDRRQSYPRPAFVEEEAEALAKEYNPLAQDSVTTSGDEEAQHRGDVEQMPILVPVPENNPERRFVLLPKTDTPSQKPSADQGGEYEANTCRKFTVPRVDAESAPSAPSVNGAAAAAAAAAAADVAGVAGAAAAAAAASAKPTVQRRRSRIGLPRIETDLEQPQTHTSASARPRSGSRSDPKSSDRHRREGSDSRDNAFLSPSIIKHATKGRDRTYFDFSQGLANGSTSHARSRDTRSSHDDRRSHDRPERTALSADTSHKRRSSSFCETDKPARRLSFNRSSRDEVSGPRGSRSSISPPPKDRKPQDSPTREHDRDRDRDHDRDHDRDRDRDRDRRDRDRDRDRERDRDRDRDRDREAPPLGRRNSYRKRRDSVVRSDNEYSSDGKAKSTAGPSLRREPSTRRKPQYKDDDALANPSASTPDVQRPLAAGAASSSRYKSASATPLATPRSSQAQIPLVAGSLAEPFSHTPSSPPKLAHEDRRRREDRRHGSASSTSSSPDSRARVPEGDRPRGPRPRSHAPNVVHNPAASSREPVPLPPLPLQSRAATLPMPIPVPIPVAVSPTHGPLRDPSSLRDREGAHRERPRSPTGSVHSRVLPQTAHPARTSGFFDPPPLASQPYRPPPFYVHIPGSTPDERQPGRPPDGPHERPIERPSIQRPDRADRLTNRPSERTSERSLVTSYLRHAEDVYNGRVQGLPECPRQHFSASYRDWRVLSPFQDFYVCPSCYEAAFARTAYRAEFVPAHLYNREERVRCTFGSMHWYRVAFFLTKKLQLPTLSLLRTLFERDEELRIPCFGAKRVVGDWFAIHDPVTGKPMPDFAACEQCVTAVRVLFPRLKPLFQRNDTGGYDTTDSCALFYEPGRKRLWRYIDVFEWANDAAMATGTPADVEGIVSRLLDINCVDECLKDVPVSGRKWFWMRSIPDFVVCEECFDEFVYPKVNTYRGVAGDFFKEPKELPLAACHLYSPRMRDIFMRACVSNDKDYLQQKLDERRSIATDITSRIHRLPKVASSADDPEAKKLLAEWKKWE